MTKKYIIHNPEGLYFITSTVVDWVDVFTRPSYKDILVSSLAFCIEKKGLQLYAWVIMSNHIHLIASAKESFLLTDIIRDFKKFTSRSIMIEMEGLAESRRHWMLRKFEFAGGKKYGEPNKKLWQDGFHPVEIYSNEVINQKLNYLHMNPVRAQIVEEPEHYIYSSARDYAGLKGLLPIAFLG